MESNYKPAGCELCEEKVSLTRHHLKPKTSRKSRPKGPIAYLCHACHSQIHRFFSNYDLRVRLHTVSKLKKTNKVRKWLVWKVGKKKNRVNREKE